MKNDTNTKKLPGFYIALCCCVIAIGAAGFIVQSTDKETSGTQETNPPQLAFVEDVPEEVAEEIPEEVIEEVAVSPEPIMDSVPAEPDIPDYAYDNPDVVSAAVVVNAEESCEFIDPLPDMTIKFGFMTDTLVYNEYYNDWRTHNGIDIEAPIGCSVCATASGTVTEVKKSSYGNTITIEHSDKFKSVYSQLGEISVKIGDSVQQGSVIGTVGESTGENIKEPHLHYELYKNEIPVNPEEY